MRALEVRLPPSLSPIDATLDAPTDGSTGSGSDFESRASQACRVHLVQGSGGELSGETEDLLRSRLRSAALLLFAGFAAFLKQDRQNAETLIKIANTKKTEFKE